VSKKLGETVLGWFVVREDAGGEDDAAQEVEAPVPDPDPVAAVDRAQRRRPAPPPPPADNAPPSVRLPGKVPQVPAGASFDAKVFTGVYSAANISGEEQARVDKTAALLSSLPSEASHAVKRQIVEASLAAFGIPVDEIIEAGVQEIQALEAYIQHGERHTQNVLGDARARTEKLAKDINEIKKLMELQLTSQQDLVRATNQQKLRVQSVLEFFGQEAIAKVVRDSPKLVEPNPQ
jgi:hypothetical protein